MKLSLGVIAAIAILLAGANSACRGNHSATAQPVAVEGVTSFDDFPLLWLGATYDSDGDGVGDMPLRVARPDRSEAFYGPDGKLIRPATRGFGLAYGLCQIAPGRDSCNVPVSLSFYPTSDAPVLSDEVKTGRTLRIRGVDATIYGGGQLWIETADVTFSISAQAGTSEDRLRQATRIANQLFGANAKAAGITKDSDFRPTGAPPPTTSATPPPTPGSGNVMSLDADASTRDIVDVSRAVTGSAPFSLGINVTAAADAYEGYQWEIEYPGSSLAFDGAVSEQTRATGMTICTASVVNGSATPLTRGDTVYGGGAGCITASGIATNYTGETTTFNMRCLAAGAFSVQLVGALQDPSFGTTLITPGGGSADTATAAITITCA